MRPFATIGMKPYKCKNVLYWTAMVISGGNFIYVLTYQGETKYDVPQDFTMGCMLEAGYKKIPIICLN
jgi:hypothetical protein